MRVSRYIIRKFDNIDLYTCNFLYRVTMREGERYKTDWRRLDHNKEEKSGKNISNKGFNAVSRECIVAVVVVVLRFVEIMQEGRKASFCDHVALQQCTKSIIT